MNLEIGSGAGKGDDPMLVKKLTVEAEAAQVDVLRAIGEVQLRSERAGSSFTTWKLSTGNTQRRSGGGGTLR